MDLTYAVTCLLRNIVIYDLKHIIYTAYVIFTARAMLVWYVLSSCVCPSVTSRYCTKNSKHRITQTTPYDSPGNTTIKNLGEIPTGSSPKGAPNRGGVG